MLLDGACGTEGYVQDDHPELEGRAFEGICDSAFRGSLD